MRDVEYKVKTFRLSEELHKKLKELKGNQSWNMFFESLIKKVK